MFLSENGIKSENELKRLKELIVLRESAEFLLFSPVFLGPGVHPKMNVDL